jgi:hypothetical protein
MKILLSLCAALALLFVAPAIHAADVTGAWSGELNTPDGNTMSLTFNFKQDGTKLTGNVESPMGPTDISNGKIDGDKFTFDISFNGMTIHHECTIVSDDEIKITSKSDSGDFPPMELTVKRVKQTAAPASSGSDTTAKPSQPPQ